MFGRVFREADQQAAVRAIKSDDFDQLEVLHKRSALNLNALMLEAAEHDRVKMLEFLLQQGATVDPVESFTDSALDVAIRFGKINSFNFLIEKKADVKRPVDDKCTPIMLAIMYQQKSMFDALLEKEADLEGHDINGNNALHLAAMGTAEMVRVLLSRPEAAILKNKRNIYGKTPLDLAIESKNDEVIQLLSPESNIDAIRALPYYGKKPVAIKQNIIMKRMSAYLEIKKRSKEFYSSKGHCGGFEFLYLLYAAQGKEDYFFDTLELISKWNRKEESLRQPFSSSLPQAAYYKNLEELLEQWINDFIWFQSHSALIPQRWRNKQYRAVGTHSDYEPVFIYSEDKIQYGKQKRNRQQLNELFMYLAKLPPHSNFEFYGAEHATSGYIASDKTISTFDANYRYRTSKPNNMEEALQRLIDYKYILLAKYAESIEFNFGIFYFRKNAKQMDFENFRLFSDQELPKTAHEATAFREQSPNKFTHLHVAVMTHSLPDIKTLLSQGYCDPEAKDVLGQTALDMASNPSFFQEDIAALFIESPHVKNFQGLLLAAIWANNPATVQRLLQARKVDVNAETGGSLPLSVALQRADEKIVQLLLESGADITLREKSSDKTLLATSIIHNKYCSVVLSRLHDLNQLDQNGNAAIHYAMAVLNIDAIKYLLERGANPQIENSDHERPFDCIGSSRIAYLMASNRRYKNLKELLHYYSKKAGNLTPVENQFYESLIQACANWTDYNDTSVLNAKDKSSGHSALSYALMSGEHARIKQLLNAGCEVEEKIVSQVRDSSDESLKELFVARGFTFGAKPGPQ